MGQPLPIRRGGQPDALTWRVRGTRSAIAMTPGANPSAEWRSITHGESMLNKVLVTHYAYWLSGALWVLHYGAPFNPFSNGL